MTDPELTKLPPQNLDAEQCVLGAMLIDPRFALPKRRVRQEDFYRTAHGLILAAILDVHAAGQDVDLITVADELRRTGQLEKAGGAAALSRLLEHVPTAANYDSHEKIVLDMSLMRQVEKACGKALGAVHERRDPDQVITEVVQALNESRLRFSGSSIIDYGQVVNMGWSEIEEAAKNPGKLRGISTGFPEVDELTNGLRKGYYYVWAARTGRGKSAFADAVARNAAFMGHRIGRISIEMMPEQDAIRAISAESGVPVRRLLAGKIHDNEWTSLAQSAGRLSALKDRIFTEYSAFKADAVARAMNILVQVHGCEAIIVDYLQLLSILDHDGTREQEVSKISRMHKEKAKELRVPVVALAQLSRAVENRLDKRPLLSDLRESGSIEQDADLIAFLHQEECTCPPWPTGCSCGKRHTIHYLQRKGRMDGTGDAELRWDGRIVRFSSKRLGEG